MGPIVGTGAFATVHQATDVRLQSIVAIKILAQNWAADPAVCERFGREATLLRRVRSSHRNAPLAEVFDIDQTSDGRPYFVMSYADRGTLASRWTVGDAWPVDRVVPIVQTLADGLHALHSAGVVHRDIKPSNMLYVTQPDAPDGEQLLIGDLGLAKDTLTATSDLTVAGGTPGYMAPEQRYPDSKITAAADVFSATVVVAELLTGLRGDAAVRQLPGHIRPVFEKGIDPTPHERQASITQWRTEIFAALDAQNAATEVRSMPPPPAPSAEPPAAPAVAAPQGIDSPVARQPKRRVGRRVLMLFVPLLLLAGIAGGAFVLLRGASAIDIDGPATANVGDTIFLRPELPDNAVSHFWTVSGQRVDDLDLRLTPGSSGSISVQLDAELRDGSVEQTVHTIVVS